MLLLHTSDWHLGRSFHGTGLLDSQRRVLAQLVDTVRERGVDAVLLAGDVYDRALPAADAVTLLDETLAALRAAGSQVVLTSGNHDSAIRLGFGSALMAAGGVHVRTDPERLAEPVLLEDAAGERAAVYGIPYLEPRHLGEAWGVDPHHTAVMTEAVRRVLADLEERRAADGPLAGVVLAHLFAAGAEGTESERDIGEGPHTDAHGTAPEGLVGTLGQVPVSVFSGLDYAALGHLHGRQTMAEHVRYSGSPLPYSFSEARHTKGGWLVHVAGGAVTEVESVDWDAGRRLAVLEDRIQPLLDSPGYAWAEDRFVQATVTDPERPEKALERLRSRFPHLLVFRHEPEGGHAARERTYAQALRQAPDDLALTTGFVDHVRGRPASEAERELLDEALTASRIGEAQA
ncbi:exonuclease subunit SbcD [Micrococcus sp. ACRRV]|uniref:metallophosphoesterase family protein n=1 Tax=Micrococcus sp. ACRRV TaxID=2918203 RepID=UPI001EF3BE24|nr:exonuclease subunit SbcD [Micrococcus sp. ACRRV]MCG7422872.1 exonuclease subunit SbcD [Micrococcus sp. ACRRV]